MISRIRSEKHFYSAENLPSYKPFSVIIRLVSVSLFAIAGLLLIVYVTHKDGIQSHIPAKYFAQVIIIYIALTELQIFIDNVLERIFPVPNRLNLRLAIQVISGIILIILAVWLTTANLRHRISDENSLVALYFSVTIAVFVVYSIANTLIVLRLSRKWVNSQKHIDQLKEEKLQMDYNSLQDQLNPHFLFNNLSVLKSLIIYDTETAVKFTENFTDVYRYVLQSKDKMLVSLNTELEFIEAYLGLHTERLGEGLKVTFQIHSESRHKEIAPLTLQLMVENAIKHNICSSDQPLYLDIFADAEMLVVINNIQLRDASYSTKTGLNNLKGRYRFLTDKELNAFESNGSFRVQVPLI